MPATRKKVRRIGILTGGGDCPGLNAVIRVVTKSAILQLGLEVIGVEDGFLGLIENRMHPLALDHVSGILTTGGTILGTTNRADPSRYAVGRDANGNPIFENVVDRVVAHVRERDIDVLVCIGGDGTMTGALPLIQRGVPVVGVPKTIDNDILHTDLTFGFQTAVQTATDCLDRLHSTASSHHRVMLAELMGRHAGWLALHAGLASGSDVILIPEIPFDLDIVCRKCVERSQRGKRFTLVAVAEGARPKGGPQVVDRIVAESPEPVRLGGISTVLASQIAEKTGLDTRATILGHIQRGGTPVASDRVLAMRFGHRAIQMVAMYEWNQMVVMQQGEIGMVPIEAVAGQQRTIDPADPLIATARSVATSLGD